MKDNKTIITSDSGMEFEFVYDYSIWSCDPKHPEFVGQEKLYKLMGQPLLNSAFEGYNTCLFAYGQTGSGKSYSIMGQGDDRGILPRFCEELFERIKCWKELQFTVEISYFEIYNEKIHDLLAPSKKKENKRVQVMVENLRCIPYFHVTMGGMGNAIPNKPAFKCPATHTVRYHGAANVMEKVTISPLGDAQTYVNGQLIVEETILHHSDRVVIGGDHFFRLNHPIEVKKRRKTSVKGKSSESGTTEAAVVVKDYEFARNELAQAQDARLQAELEEAKEEARIKAQEEIVVRIQEAKEAAQQEMTLQKEQYEEKVSHLHEAMESLTTEKKQAEQSKQTAVEKISELQAHRMLLEQEILNNRKRLQMEALAAKQVSF
ncbi:PREDICTED: kinesin-like protein KIF14 [Acropora digitifera]|uniref:kinesin-like protein KIF14 n=1 Tax=Acropora digitifera TaxID=70779 RepID=UPI00077AC62B|nr:PREDICTED: kinesin-like protein KIF14 [Acropora digitifera]